MKDQNPPYRTNFVLIITFLVLISISLVVALSLAYTLTRRYVENGFSAQKIDVLEETIKPYNEFFQIKIPEISFYQGFLDSASAVKYTDSIFRKYSFVDKVVFYDTQISNHQVSDGFSVNNFSIEPKAIYQFKKNLSKDSILLFNNSWKNALSLKTTDEFNQMAIKFSAFIESTDTTRAISSDQSFNIFYSITPNRITYMNNPSREEIKIFKDLMLKELPTSPFYEQDILTFYLNSEHLKINNIHPELYQEITIKPLVYESLDNTVDLLTTDIPLPGAFADYKLYFSSSKVFLNKEINNRFMPIAAILLLIYSILVFIAYLIYQNLNVNRRMFKLQYDFINNLTHEFKTPVSVIKIAGNNIRSANELSDVERKHYGKILDEEADKLNDLMNKLLSFTQIENKAITFNEEDIVLRDFTDGIVNAHRIKHPDFKITCQIKDVKKFTTDPVLLRSIFDNMMDNAYKYSPSYDKAVKIQIFKDKKNVVFRFTDRGIGIPKDEMVNIFKKFYRIQSEYNQQGSVGLGLAFCKELVNFMNGEIYVESTIDEGSEFTIVLPYEHS